MGKINEHVYKTNYSWPHTQLTDEQFSQYSGGLSESRVALQVYEDGELLRGYRNRHDPDYEGYDTVRGIAGPYRTIDELDPENDNGKLPQYLRRPDINIPGRFMYVEAGHDLYVWCADGASPEGKQYNIPIKTHLITVNATGVTLTNLLLRYSGGYAVVLNGADNTTIDHCYLDNNIYGISVYNSKDVKISNNLIRVKGLWDRYWYDDVKATILGSYMIRVKGFSSSSGCDIFNNILCGSYGILASGQGMRIHHNIISYGPSVLINASEINEGRGVAASYDHDLRVYDNIIHHADFSSIAVSFVSKGDFWIYRNIAYEAKYFIKDGTEYESQVGSESRGKKYLYHNTVVGINSIVHSPYEYMCNKKTVLRNNIFMSDVHLYAFYEEGIDYFPFATGPDSDNNLLWMTGQDEIAVFRINSELLKRYEINEFDTFTADTGLDVHSIFVNPGFNDLNTNELNNLDTVSSKPADYFITHGYDTVFQTSFAGIRNQFSLSDDSPAIDNAINLDGYPDYVHNEHKDIGALEFPEGTRTNPVRNLRVR